MEGYVMSDVDKKFWEYYDTLPRFEPFNSANGEAWKDYQARQKEFLIAQEKQSCAYYKKLENTDYQRKKRADDTDKSKKACANTL